MIKSGKIQDTIASTVQTCEVSDYDGAGSVHSHSYHILTSFYAHPLMYAEQNLFLLHICQVTSVQETKPFTEHLDNLFVSAFKSSYFFFFLPISFRTLLLSVSLPNLEIGYLENASKMISIHVHSDRYYYHLRGGWMCVRQEEGIIIST